MKHIATPSMSVNTRKPYTAAGFGDRIHSVTIGYQYSLAHQTPVTLHLTHDKVTGGAPHIDKAQSWQDIVALFPPGHVSVRSHVSAGLPNAEWVQYLRTKGIDAECYYYADTYGMHRYDEIAPIDASAYLKTNPCLTPVDCSADVTRPSKPYATMQWDAGGKPWCDRRLSDDQCSAVIGRYLMSGIDMVTVGGDAVDDCLSQGPAAAGYLMAGAALHIGTDSGLFHLAQLYMKPEQTHLYTARSRSHHARRWIANGSIPNHYL